MQKSFLYKYHFQKNKKEEDKSFRLFILAQFVHYGALLLLFLAGLFFIVVAIKGIF